MSKIVAAATSAVATFNNPIILQLVTHLSVLAMGLTVPSHGAILTNHINLIWIQLFLGP